MKPDVSVLKNVGFRRLWLSQLTSTLATNLLTFGYVLALYEISGSNAYVALLVGFQSIPPIIFSSVAGVIADSYGRRRIMVWVNLGRALVALLSIFTTQSAFIILVAAFFLQIISQFFVPAAAAAIPQVVKPEKLFAANSFFTLTMYAMFLVGYGAAGPLIDLIGTPLTFALAMLLYLIATLASMLLPKLDEHLKMLSHKTLNFFHQLGLVWHRFVEGLRYVRRDLIIFFILLQVSVLIAVEKAFASLMPAFALDFLGFSKSAISFTFILPTALGTLIGVILANRLKTKISKFRLISTGLVLDALALLFAVLIYPIANSLHWLLPSLSPEVFRTAIVICLAMLSGFADPFIIVSAQTILQERVPNQEQGRVFGLQNTVQNMFAFLPVFIIGALDGILAVPVIISVLGALIAVMAFLGIYFFKTKNSAG